jgi:hypothetical protein
MMRGDGLCRGSRYLVARDKRPSGARATNTFDVRWQPVIGAAILLADDQGQPGDTPPDEDVSVAKLDDDLLRG